jgi:hypothetical protein
MNGCSYVYLFIGSLSPPLHPAGFFFVVLSLHYRFCIFSVLYLYILLPTTPYFMPTTTYCIGLSILRAFCPSFALFFYSGSTPRGEGRPGRGRVPSLKNIPYLMAIFAQFYFKTYRKSLIHLFLS